MLIVSNSREIEKQRQKIAKIKGGFQKAFVRASKRVASQGRTQISKDIRESIAIKASDLKPVLNISRYKSGATIRLKESQRLSLAKFGAKQNDKGVSYKIQKQSGRTFVAGAFQGQKPGAMKASWRGNVFKRVGKSRLPIQKLMGASAWGVFVARKMFKPTEADLQQKFEQRLRHEIDYLLEKGQTRNG
jgi:hypothetical protein